MVHSGKKSKIPCQHTTCARVILTKVPPNNHFTPISTDSYDWHYPFCGWLSSVTLWLSQYCWYCGLSLQGMVWVNDNSAMLLNDLILAITRLFYSVAVSLIFSSFLKVRSWLKRRNLAKQGHCNTLSLRFTKMPVLGTYHSCVNDLCLVHALVMSFQNFPPTAVWQLRQVFWE